MYKVSYNDQTSVYMLPVNSTGRFAPWTFRPQDVSPLDVLPSVPRLWTFRPRLLFIHWTLAYTTACTTVQSMITACTVVLLQSER